MKYFFPCDKPSIRSFVCKVIVHPHSLLWERYLCTCFGVRTVHRCSRPHSHFRPSNVVSSYTSFTPCGNTAITVAIPSKGVITLEPTCISPIVCHPDGVSILESSGCCLPPPRFPPPKTTSTLLLAKDIWKPSCGLISISLFVFMLQRYLIYNI